MLSSTPLFLRRLTFRLLISSILATKATALFQTGSSPTIQDPFLNPPRSTCPVAQDGSTSDTFPWTHNPTCVNAVIPSPDGTGLGIHQDFCVYTNAVFNSGRGISLITTPDVAASLTAETFQPFFDELEGAYSGEGGMWKVKESEGKGLGLFAKTTITEGTTLILKSPVLFVAREALNTPSRQRRHLLLKTAVEQLPDETRDAVMGLAKSKGSANEIDDIVQTNGIGVRAWDERQSAHLVIVPEAARVNHACRPNAYYRFDDFTLNFEAFALKNITAGEEITFSYGYSSHTHEERLDALENTWGFTCKCSLCTSNSTILSNSDARLKEIASIKQVLPTDPNDIPQFIAMLPHLISLLEEEGLQIEMPMYEEILAYTWSSFGIEDRARHWAGRARRHWEILAGKESWEAQRTGQLERDVKAHGTWASWEGDPWEGVGKGHPWDEHDHEHDH